MPIRVATIAELLSGSDWACTHVGTLSEGGAYLRRLPFRMDNRALDAALRADVEAYFADNARGFGAVRHLALRDALVVGQGSVVTHDLRLIRESAHEFVGGGLVPDGMIDNGGGGLALGSEPAGTIDRPTLLLKRPWSANYGHWLVDSAALLALAAGLTLPAGWQIAVRRQSSPAMREIVRQTLDILAPDVPVLELPDDEIWRFS